MSSNINYNELEKGLKDKSEIILKTKKMLDFLEEEGVEIHFKLEEYKTSNIVYTSYEMDDVDCLLIYELRSNNINIAKVIFKYEIKNKSEILQLLNLLNSNDMYNKYVMIDKFIETSVKYSAFAEDFNPAMLHEYMKICINSLRQNINYILNFDC